MSLKARLQRLEDSQKAKAVYQETPESKEKTLEWLNSTIRDINERRRLIDEGLLDENAPMPPSPPSPHCDMSGYSPKQLEANASARRWIDEVLEQIRRSEHEQSKNPIG